MTSNEKNKASRWIRRALMTLSVAAMVLAAFFLSVTAHDNFHIVSTGLVYRSAQMNAAALNEVIKEYGIKSIVNLRGSGPDKDWYVAEVNTARHLGVQHFDFALSASHELKDGEMDEILATLRDAPKPVLVHCKSGSDRTGLVGALYLYGLEGMSAPQASRQLSVLYGHVPHLLWSETFAMDNSFWRYVKDHGQPTANSRSGHDRSQGDAPALAGPNANRNPSAH